MLDRIGSREEAIVEAGISEIPLQRLNADGLIVQRGMRFGGGGDRLEPCKIDNAEVFLNEIPSVNAVVGDGSPEISDDEPPALVLSTSNALQQKAFLLLWKKPPAYLRGIHVGFERNLWTAAEIDALGDLLCKNAHRFSKHCTDLRHVTVDPFRIILKKYAQPVKQRKYRHSPVLAAKVQILINWSWQEYCVDRIQIGPVHW